MVEEEEEIEEEEEEIEEEEEEEEHSIEVEEVFFNIIFIGRGGRGGSSFLSDNDLAAKKGSIAGFEGTKKRL